MLSLIILDLKLWTEAVISAWQTLAPAKCWRGLTALHQLWRLFGSLSYENGSMFGLQLCSPRQKLPLKVRWLLHYKCTTGGFHRDWLSEAFLSFSRYLLHDESETVASEICWKRSAAMQHISCQMHKAECVIRQTLSVLTVSLLCKAVSTRWSQIQWWCYLCSPITNRHFNQ